MFVPFTGCIDDLRREVTLLEDAFAEIEDSTYDTIVRQQISVHQLTRLLCTPRRDVKDFFQRLLDRDSTLQGLWDALSTYWTFYDYTLLEKLVGIIGDESSATSLAHYASKLSEFQRRTRLCDFAQYSIMISKHLPPDDFVDVGVQLSSDSFFLEELNILSASLCERFGLPKFIAVLKSIHPCTNTVDVVWAVPAQFLEQLRNTSRTCPPDLRGKHTIRTIGGKEWKYLSSRNRRKEPFPRGR
jgi:hypothetical protein